mgnify:CR=1 FL=1
MPDFVLPFKISKEQAIEKFLSFTRKKHFIPKDFFEKSQVQKMTGVYFPYWIYGGDFETDYIARGRKVRVWQTGDVEYTETSIYDVRREGEVRVDGLSRNALNKADRDLIECVQPYRLEEMQPFSMGYLSGFQAEKRDIEQQQIAPELKKDWRRWHAAPCGMRRTNISPSSRKNEPFPEAGELALRPVSRLDADVSGKGREGLLLCDERPDRNDQRRFSL